MNRRQFNLASIAALTGCGGNVEYEIQSSPKRTHFQAQVAGIFEPWTPTITFAVPGDLSVVYSAQDARYTVLENLIFITYRVVFTPTFTTSSGNLHITGVYNANSTFTIASYDGGVAADIPPPGGRTWLTAAYALASGVAVLLLRAHGGGAGSIPIEASHLTSTTTYDIRGQLLYYLAR